jgi:hypothetical protein
MSVIPAHPSRTRASARKASAAAAHTHDHDADYAASLEAVRATFAGNAAACPLMRTDVAMLRPGSLCDVALRALRGGVWSGYRIDRWD